DRSAHGAGSYRTIPLAMLSSSDCSSGFARVPLIADKMVFISALSPPFRRRRPAIRVISMFRRPSAKMFPLPANTGSGALTGLDRPIHNAIQYSDGSARAPRSLSHSYLLPDAWFDGGAMM